MIRGRTLRADGDSPARQVASGSHSRVRGNVRLNLVDRDGQHGATLRSLLQVCVRRRTRRLALEGFLDRRAELGRERRLDADKRNPRVAAQVGVEVGRDGRADLLQDRDALLVDRRRRTLIGRFGLPKRDDLRLEVLRKPLR